MIERQPVLLALEAAARTDGFVERIVARRAAEQFHVAAAEKCDRMLAEGHLRYRHQNDLRHRLQRSLRLDVERLDALDRVAKKIEADRCLTAGRKQVENTAANGEFARLHDGGRARIARQRQTAGQLAHIDALARRQNLHGVLDELPRRHFLQNRVHRGQNDRRILAAAVGQFGQCRDALCNDVGVRADAVIGHRIPRGKRNDLHLRGEELQRVFDLFGAAVVARDVQVETGAGPAARLVNEISQHEGVEAFGDAA